MIMGWRCAHIASLAPSPVLTNVTYITKTLDIFFFIVVFIAQERGGMKI